MLIHLLGLLLFLVQESDVSLPEILCIFFANLLLLLVELLSRLEIRLESALNRFLD